MKDSDAEKSNTPDKAEQQRAIVASVARTALTAVSSQETSPGYNSEVGESNDTDEPFGVEESYWTVYRMFASQKNLGKPWNLKDIWEYLSNIYNMSLETTDTLEETLIEWSEDIQADAADRGIQGTFMKYAGSYVFAGLVTSVLTRPSPSRSSESDVRRRAAPVNVASKKVETDPALKSVEDDIKSVLDNSPDGVVKQAEIKKSLMRDSEELSQEELQESIDKLVEMGRIYKFRRGNAAYLALEPRETEPHTAPESDKEVVNEKETFDIKTSVAILGLLSAPGSHFERKQTMNQLWVNLNGDKHAKITDEGLERLKKSCRQLMRIGLVTAGPSRHVYKVGLASQGIKEEIQKILEGNNPDDYLRQRFSELIN